MGNTTLPPPTSHLPPPNTVHNPRPRLVFVCTPLGFHGFWLRSSAPPGCSHPPFSCRESWWACQGTVTGSRGRTEQDIRGSGGRGTLRGWTEGG